MKIALAVAGLTVGAYGEFKPEVKRTKGEVCMGLADGIEAQMLKTKKQNFGGGNTKWEEKSLGRWATSETRLIEVIENACGGGYGNMDLASMDMTRAGKNADCYSMLEQNEEWIEEWFEGDPDAKPKSNFYNEFCVIKKKLCCQNRETFGRNCDPCPKFKDVICNGHGKCSGAGDKEGKGKCICEDNFTGSKCQHCHEDYYLNKSTDLCEECHKSCKTCHGPSKRDCKACGSEYVPKEISKDVFECRRMTEDERHKSRAKKEEL